jgi:hypothetical protein
MIADGVNLASGLAISFPSRAIGSPPDLTCLPSDTRSVHSRETRVPSKVSTRASWMRNVLEMRLMMVELSLRVSKAAEIAARGPLVKAMIAAWGKYAKTNMKVVTPTLSVNVETSLDVSGRHRLLWAEK